MMYVVDYIARYWFKDDEYHTEEMSQEQLDEFCAFVSGLRCGSYEIIHIEPLTEREVKYILLPSLSSTR